MNIDTTNRYQYSDLLQEDNVTFWGTRPPVDIPESEDDQYHTVTQTDARRIDLIAHKYYDDVKLWWIIAEANRIDNPLELEPGTVLRIPALETIQMKVLA